MVVAEDIVESSIVKAVSLVDRDRPVHFVGWLKSIIRNQCIHWRRDELRRRARMPKEGDLLYRNRTPDSMACTSEALEIFHRAAARLTEMQRAVLWARIFERLPYEEIGRRLGLTPGAARALVFRARSTFTDFRAYVTGA